MNASGGTVAVNGIDMYFERRGDGEPLLLIHGGGGAGVNWRLIFESAPDGYELIVLDPRGHGRPARVRRRPVG